MTDFPQLLLVFFAAVNPASTAPLLGSANGSARTRGALLGLVLGGGLLATCALAANSVLGFLEVEPETFRIAAGIVIAVWGVRWMLPMARSESAASDLMLSGALPLGWPGIANPAAVAASLSFGANSEPGAVVAAAFAWAVVAAGAAFLLTGRLRRPMEWATVTTGALAAVIGANLIVEGVLAV